ncbi:hypothetical protein ACSSS7_003504 [Eimeria intestinalis]
MPKKQIEEASRALPLLRQRSQQQQQRVSHRADRCLIGCSCAMIAAAFGCVSPLLLNASKRLWGPSLLSIVSSGGPQGAPSGGPHKGLCNTSYLVSNSTKKVFLLGLLPKDGCACSSSDYNRKRGPHRPLGPPSDLCLGPPSASAANEPLTSSREGPLGGHREIHGAFAHACGVGGSGLAIQLRLSAPRRAPKKKGGGGGAGGGAPAGAGSAGGKGAPSGYDHVFNIYKDIKEDAEMLPDECYPKWLWRLADKPKSYGQLASIFLYGRVRCC